MHLPGVRPVLARASNWYRASVGDELRRYGLRYDDLLNEHDPETQKAISQLSPHEVEMRNKRLKRAMDTDIKRTYLSEDIQKAEDPWNPYLRTRIEELRKERLERQTYD